MTSSREGASLNIGEVLARLRPEFPDISPSKIRFLEAEGLIEPARSRSGYRQFALADVERLQYILTTQRDEYLPLRVIKERLDALDGDGRAYPADAGHRARRRRGRGRGRPAASIQRHRHDPGRAAGGGRDRRRPAG